ncbi:hypothetical protein C482_02426 [Natrialba chahannaoensis JCM 10990]|uniref:Uncharacterized protein n=1 Tax=Natrialba chahannaoensis JCM 10990 TaxID=1227492 RepID=M0B6T9_9EURY|nr:hypothetical protein C482_02426 [Natrialba chahannaoensis JCM 10990]
MGRTPHAREEVSPTNRSDARCICGEQPDGYDARTNEPACEDCAYLRSDGGQSAEERQADALETIADELRYQNAVFAEVISTIDAIHGGGLRSASAISTAIDDHAVTREAQGVSR